MPALSRLAAALLTCCLLAPPPASAGDPTDLARERVHQREDLRERWSAEAQAKRLEAMDALKILLRDHDHAPETKAQLLLRLADLQWRQGASEAARAFEDHDRALLACDDAPAEAGCADLRPDLRARDQWRGRAVETWATLLGLRPTDTVRDQALFSFAHGAAALGDPVAALAAYRRLVKTSPRSDRAPAAHTAIGELLFDEGNVHGALTAFRRAAAFEDAEERSYALYKMAWCHYNLGDFDAGIERLEEVVRLESDGGGAVGMRDDALRDLVLFFSEVGDLDRAVRSLDRHGDEARSRRLLAALADKYAARGADDEARRALQLLIARDPLAADNPTHQAGIVAIARRTDDRDAAEEALARLARTYGPESSWADRHGDRPAVLADAARAIDDALRDYAVDTHRQAIKQRSRALLERADAAYARYLALPAPRKAYAMRFWHAELLYKRKAFDAAGDAYAAVVDADPRGEHAVEAAIGAVFAAEQAIAANRDAWDRADTAERRARLASDDPAERYAPLPLRPGEQRLVDACDRFARVAPDDERTLDVLYKAAGLLAAHNRFRESNARYEAIIAAQPRSELAQFAVHDVLDSYARIEAWPELHRVSLAFHDDPDVGVSDTFKAELWTIHQRSGFEAASELGRLGRSPEAAPAFEGFVTRFPDSDVRDVALFNAAHHAALAGDRARAVALRHRFVEAHPEPVGDDARDLQLWEKATSLLADHYRSVAWFDRAAGLYRGLFDRRPGFAASGYTSAVDGLYLAAAMREDIGDLAAAIVDWRAFLAARPQDDEAVSVRLRIARLLAEDFRAAEAAEAYAAVHRDPDVRAGDPEPLLAAIVGHGRLLARAEDPDAQARLYRSVTDRLDAAELQGPAAALAAEIRFSLLEPAYAAYAALVLDGPGDLAVKSRRLEQLERDYLSVLDLKQGEWGIAALYRIGSLYDDFAEEVLRGACPPKLTEPQCELYLFRKEDAAAGFVDKAARIWDEATRTSHELGLYTEYTERALRGLEALRPEEYPARPEVVPAPGFQAHDNDRTADFVE